jgi:hypothetical protein
MELQYELVEKPIVRLPPQYRDLGCVVMDGPFGCVDPEGTAGYHLVGHVDLAVHDRATGIHSPSLKRDPASRFHAMRYALAEYMPFMADAEYVDSHWVTRVVLPNRDDTDERPSMVTRLDDQVIRVFAGKLGHAVNVAGQVVSMIGEEREAAA